MVFRSVFFLCLLASPAWAAGSQSEAPYFQLPTGAQLPLEESRAEIGIVGPVARVQVTQTYVNQGPTAIEAVYVFPASTQAAVHGMRMTIGARTIEAQIQKRDQARADYEEAKAQGQTASLLEQERPNVFTMNVANILPGDRIQVVLDYSELIVPTDGVYELVYPAVVGPRYSGGGEAWAQNPHSGSGAAPSYRFGVRAKIESGLPLAAVSCPSHPVTPHFSSARGAVVELSDPGSGDRDFVLRYRLSQGAIEGGLSLFPQGDGGYFLLQLEPPARVAPEQILPREYLFVVDVSGSMGGFPLESSKTLIRNLLGRLRPTDRFNILLFAGGSRVLSPTSLPVTPANLQRALELIDQQGAGGGTELLPALSRALALPRAKEASSTAIVLITDGYVTVEREALELIQKNLGRANLFTFGIGSSVNRYLIEALARAGLGEPFVVLDQAAAPDAAERLIRYVESPVLTQVTVEAQGFLAQDLEPAVLPDLYAARPLVLLGRYRGPAGGRLVVRGQTPNGPFEQIIRVSDAVPSDDQAVLRTLWARKRVERLSDLAGAQSDDGLVAEVTKLGLEHRIMTAHTSFVAIDSARRNRGGSTTVRQVLPTPAGVSHGQVFGANGLGSGAGYGGLGLRGTGAGGGGRGLGTMGGVGAGGSGILEGKAGKRDLNVQQGSPLVMGSLDKDVIRRVIQSHRAKFAYCYEKGLLRQPELSGKVVLRFVIAGDGKTSKVEFDPGSTLKDAAVEECLLKAARLMKFPAPTGGGVVVVKYPLLFRSS
jgi:Ca-activated chloride channel family protein